MKLAIAGFGALVTAVVVLVVVAIVTSRDPVPDRLRDCVRDTDARRAVSDVDLQVARADIDAGGRAVREVERFRIGGHDAVLLEGARWRILVMEGEGSPSLAQPGLARRVYERIGEYAYVGIEIGAVRGALRGCALSVS